MSLLKKVKEVFNKPPDAKKEEEQKVEDNQGTHFTLSVDKQTEVCEMIDMMVEDSKNSRAEFMEKRSEGIRLYEGIRAPKNKPWPNCSNISTMITTVAADLLHAKLMPMVWTPDTIHWEGREEHDAAIAEDIKDVMNYVVTPSEMDLEPTVDDIIHTLVVDGTVIAKLAWRTYWTYVTRKVPKELTADMVYRGKLEYNIEYDYVMREKCTVELRPIERVFLPYNASNEQDCESIIEELWYTMPELREMQAHGYIPESVNLDTLVKGGMDQLEEFSGTALERMQAEGTSAVNTRKENYKIKCYEACVKYDVNGDKVREECVFLVIAGPMKKYLAGKPLHTVSRIGKRPWKIRPFLRRPGRIYGKSIPELVMHLHKEMDAIHNQRIDAGNIAIAPFFFYRAATGMQPNYQTVGPATGIPLDDPDRDVRFPTFPGFGLQVSFQEERIIMELIEKLTYLTPAMMGKEVASRPTARGTLAVMAQGEQKFSLLARRVQYIIASLLTDIKQKYEENMPPDLQERILGKEGARRFAYLAPETIAGQYDCKMALDLNSGNVGQDREISTLMMQTMAFDPFVQQNPAYGWEIRADFLRSHGKKDVENRIGPKPPTLMDEKGVEDVFRLIQQQTPVRPRPGEDHVKILSKMLEIKGSEAYEALPDESKVLFDRYIADTKLMYIEQMQERMSQYAETFGRGQAAGGMGGAEEPALTPGAGGTAGAGSPGPIRSPGGGPASIGAQAT